MWPATDSGYEADPYSPAGTAQNEMAFARGMGRFRFGKLAIWLILIVLVVAPVTISIIAVTRPR
jgi:hypothetical protein